MKSYKKVIYHINIIFKIINKDIQNNILFFLEKYFTRDLYN